MTLNYLASNGEVDIPSDSNYYLTPTGIQQAKQAARNNYEYQNSSVPIDVNQKQSDTVQYILSDTGHSDNGQVVNSINYEGIPGQSDTQYQGLLNDIANGQLDGLDSNIYQSDSGITKQDAKKGLQQSLHYQNGVIKIWVSRVKYSSDTVKFYYKGQLINTYTSTGKSGNSDSNLKDASESELNGYIGNSD